MTFRTLAGVLLIAGCTHTRVVATAPPVAQPDPARGSVSVTLLNDPDAPSLRLAPGEEYVPPQIAPGNPLPAYPADLVALHLEPQIVAVRMVIDEARHISQVSSSPLQESTDGPHRAAFEESVRTAVAKWTAWPAEIRKFKPGPDVNGDGKPDYPILVEQCLLKAYYDISFVFELAGGKPVVHTATPQP